VPVQANKHSTTMVKHQIKEHCLRTNTHNDDILDDNLQQ